MKLDEKATEYRFGNGRFDLMTDEQVRTLTSDDLSKLLMYLSADKSPSLLDEELGHHLYELLLRYPYATFRLEVQPESEGA